MDMFSILFGLKGQFLKNVAIREATEQVVDVILGPPGQRTRDFTTR